MEWFFATTLGKTWDTTIGEIHKVGTDISPEPEIFPAFESQA